MEQGKAGAEPSQEAPGAGEGAQGAAAPQEAARQDAAAQDQEAQAPQDGAEGELPEEGEIQTLQAEIEDLKGQLKDQAAKARSDLERMARAAAESDNRRKRAEADVERERKYGNERLLKAMLPVVDALELAMKHIDPSSEAMKATSDGLTNTMNLFLKTLADFGVAAEDPKGKPFDPAKHQAISMVESAAVGNNCVLDVMQKGYILNGRVVRPAMVVVARNSGQKKPEPAKDAPGDGAGEGQSQGKTINIEA